MTNEKQSMLFTQLVLLFQTAALQHMGKLKNPISDKVERDLFQAQLAIDMLDMIQNKMRGNLSSDEERMLTAILNELKINYVDEAAKEQSSISKNDNKTDAKQ